METKKCSLLKSVNSFLDAIGGNLSKLTVELQGLYTEWLTPKFSEMTEQSTSFERDILGHNDDRAGQFFTISVFKLVFCVRELSSEPNEFSAFSCN